jgi:hypothetical protein
MMRSSNAAEARRGYMRYICIGGTSSPNHSAASPTMVSVNGGWVESEQRNTVSSHMNSPEWRSWSNPEFLLSGKGLRLDELDKPRI